MCRFYQRQNPNFESSLFHHGLIRILVNAQLLKMGDSWQSFLVKNGFVSLPSESSHSLPMCVDEPTSRSISSHSLQSFWFEIQVSKDPVSPFDTPIEFLRIVEVTSKKCEFSQRNHWRKFLSHLIDKPSFSLDPIQNMVNEDKIKIKRQGKKVTQKVNYLDFINKRNGKILSRMTRNRHQNHDKPIPQLSLRIRSLSRMLVLMSLEWILPNMILFQTCLHF